VASYRETIEALLKFLFKLKFVLITMGRAEC
jgi:hypothetical protein